MTARASPGRSRYRSGAMASAEPATAMRASMLRRDIRFWKREVAALTILSVTVLPAFRGRPSWRSVIGEEQLWEIRDDQIPEVADQDDADQCGHTEERQGGQQRGQTGRWA